MITNNQQYYLNQLFELPRAIHNFAPAKARQLLDLAQIDLAQAGARLLIDTIQLQHFGLFEYLLDQDDLGINQAVPIQTTDKQTMYCTPFYMACILGRKHMVKNLAANPRVDIYTGPSASDFQTGSPLVAVHTQLDNVVQRHLMARTKWQDESHISGVERAELIEEITDLPVVITQRKEIIRFILAYALHRTLELDTHALYSHDIFYETGALNKKHKQALQMLVYQKFDARLVPGHFPTLDRLFSEVFRFIQSFYGMKLATGQELYASPISSERVLRSEEPTAPLPMRPIPSPLQVPGAESDEDQADITMAVDSAWAAYTSPHNATHSSVWQQRIDEAHQALKEIAQQKEVLRLATESAVSFDNQALKSFIEKHNQLLKALLQAQVLTTVVLAQELAQALLLLTRQLLFHCQQVVENSYPEVPEIPIIIETMLEKIAEFNAIPSIPTARRASSDLGLMDSTDTVDQQLPSLQSPLIFRSLSRGSHYQFDSDESRADEAGLTKPQANP